LSKERPLVLPEILIKMPSVLKKIFKRGKKKNKQNKGKDDQRFAELDTEKLRQLKQQNSLNVPSQIQPNRPMPYATIPHPTIPHPTIRHPGIKESQSMQTQLSNSTASSGRLNQHLKPNPRVNPAPNTVTNRTTPQSRPVKHNIVDLDDSSFEDTDVEEENNNNSDRNERLRLGDMELNSQLLQQHQQQLQYQTRDAGKMQLQRMSNGKLVKIDPKDINGDSVDSPTSTDFCLSTDLEDEGYNRLRRDSSVNKHNASSTRNSISPKSNSSEEDVVFPGIQNDNSQESINDAEDDLSALTPSPQKKYQENQPTTSESDFFPFPDSKFNAFSASNESNSNLFDSSSNGFGLSSVDPDSFGVESKPSSGSQKSSPKGHVYADSSDSEFDAEEDLHLNKPGSERKSKNGRDFFHESSAEDFNWPGESKQGHSSKEESVSSRKSPEMNKFPSHGDKKYKAVSQKQKMRTPTSHKKSKSSNSIKNTRQFIVSPSPEDAQSTHSSHYSRSSNTASKKAKEKLRRKNERRHEKESKATRNIVSTTPALLVSTHPSHQDDDSASLTSEDPDNDWLFQEIQGTLGPVGVAADLESLSGRSTRSVNSRTSSVGGKSYKSTKSTKSHRTSKSRRGRKSKSRKSSADSVSSRHSHRSTLSHMSDASRSVAKDLMRLELQLAMVEKEKVKKERKLRHTSRTHSSGSLTGLSDVGSYTSGGNFNYTAKSMVSESSSSSRRGKSSRSTTNSYLKRNRVVVVAPPGKLGIILANKSEGRGGTVVSSVRDFSILREKIFPGDRLEMIDGEDVSRMLVSEITSIMARKGEFERTLTILTAPGSGPGRGSSSSKMSDYNFNDGASSFTGSYASSSYSFHAR